MGVPPKCGLGGHRRGEELRRELAELARLSNWLLIAVGKPSKQ